MQHRLPGIYWNRNYVEAGGLMSYSFSTVEVGRRAAYFVDKILRGGPSPPTSPSSNPRSSS